MGRGPSDIQSTEFNLDEWTDGDRAVLTESLVESEVPHRWENATVVVAADAEDAVDDLLDAIEAGELMSADESGANEPPEGTLSKIFLAADKLAKDPVDAKSRRQLIELNDIIDTYGRSDPNKYRAVIYYMLTKRFQKDHVYG